MISLWLSELRTTREQIKKDYVVEKSTIAQTGEQN